MRHGSLFSGIGGFDLASEWMGWENVFHCEWNEFGQKVLKYYWPNAISYGDITKTDFTIHRGGIDILTGGFPCQPFSLAGKRKGTEDDRHLWPEMLRCIREVQPTWVVGENVFGIVNWDGGLVFNQVQSDLESEGYEVQPYVLPACAVNAPHRRDRTWFVAYSNSRRYSRTTEVGRNGINAFGTCRAWAFANPHCRRWNEGTECELHNIGEREGCSDISNNQNQVWCEFGNGSKYRTTPDTNLSSARSPGESGSIETSRRNNNDEPGKWRGTTELNPGPHEFLRNATNPRNQGLQGSKVIGSTCRVGKEQYKQPSRFLRPDWSNFPTQSPVRNGNDGFPTNLAGITVSKHRNESIKAGGNAIVPQVVYQIFKAIEEYELTTRKGINQQAMKTEEKLMKRGITRYGNGLVGRLHNRRMSVIDGEDSESFIINFEQFTKETDPCAFHHYDRGIRTTMIGISKEGGPQKESFINQILKTTTMEKFTFTTKLNECCSTDPLRPTFNSVHFMNGYACATDGKIAIRQSLEYHTIINPELLDGKSLHRDNYKSVMTFEISEATEDGISCKDIDGRTAFFEYQKLEGDQPNYDSIFSVQRPNTALNFVGISPALLTKLSKAIYTPSGAVRFRFTGIDTPILVDAVGVDNQEAIIMPAILEDTLF